MNKNEIKAEARWLALHNAAVDYAQAWHKYQTTIEDSEEENLAHAEVVLKAEAERYRRLTNLQGGGK